jgi:hypothetical protein
MQDGAGLQNDLYEALPYAAELHVASANPLRINSWEMMDVDPTQVFVDDRVLDEISTHLGNTISAAVSTNTATTTRAATHAHGTEPPKAIEASATAENVDPAETSISNDDPYDLKDRFSAVYVLYRTAELCAHDPEFKQTLNPRDRRKIAHGVFERVLNAMPNSNDAEIQRQKELRQLFSQTRLEHALRLIDPDYDHNSGRSADQQIEWPPACGKEFLAQQVGRRPQFVSYVLALIIWGAAKWLAWNTQPPSDGQAKSIALQQWLEEHGLTGESELKTSFGVITSNRGRAQLPPKYVKQPTSHSPGGEVHRVLRRRV